MYIIFLCRPYSKLIFFVLFLGCLLGGWGGLEVGGGGGGGGERGQGLLLVSWAFFSDKMKE